MSNKLDQTLVDLHLHRSQLGTHCPLLPEEIAAHEAAGRIVDLDTGEVSPDITADTRVIPITEHDFDAAIIEIRAALARLENHPSDDNAFLRGFKSGAESAYRDALRLMEGASSYQRDPAVAIVVEEILVEREIAREEACACELGQLADFQHNATADTFRHIFGNVGDHLWHKFQRYDANLLRLCDQLDDYNRAALVAYLNSEGGPERWLRRKNQEAR